MISADRHPGGGMNALLLFSSTLVLARASLVVSRAAVARATPLRRLHPPSRLLMCAVVDDDGDGGGKRAARRRRSSPASRRGSSAVGSTPTSSVQAKAVAELAACAPNEWLCEPAMVASLASYFAKVEQPRKLLELYEQARSGTSLMTAREVLPLVVRALLRMRRVDLALELHDRHFQERPHLPEPSSACVLFLALCRTSRLAEASRMLSDLEAAHPRPTEPPADASWRSMGEGEEPMWHAVGAVMLPALASALLEGEDAAGALALTLRMADAADVCAPPVHTLTKLLRAFGKARCLPGVYACLDVQARGDLRSDAEGRQAVVDALVRSVRFVKGGVSMATLPADPIAELAFIGRSNVGKSSLVNMVLGRRAIAYTSKTPGKTQQYNYFALNEQPASTSEWQPFHLVDLPGLGYAKVPEVQRRKWLTFLGDYATDRPQLRLVVHLIDAQVGPMATDLEIMRILRDAHAAQLAVSAVGSATGSAAVAVATSASGAEQVCGWQYAVVLTKVDKGKKSTANVERAVRQAIAESGCPPPVSIIPTSSRSKAGREDVWRLMRCVVLPDEPDE